MNRRYFEITQTDGRTPVVYVEYDSEFGEWSRRQCIYRWEFVDKKQGVVWFVSSNLVTDYHHVIKDLQERLKQAWQTVDMKAASNPLSARKPAMRRKGKA